jgi:hypothetical protein
MRGYCFFKDLTITPAPTVDAGTAVATCSDAGAINITGGSSASNYGTVTWTSNGTGTIANPNSLTNATYTPGAGETGNVILTLTATGNGTCSDINANKNITINGQSRLPADLLQLKQYVPVSL